MTLVSAGTYRQSVTGASPVTATVGRLVRIIVTTAGSAGALTVYDNPSAPSGTVLFNTVGTAAVGTIYELQVPAYSGIYVAPGTGQTVLVVWD